MIRHQILTPKKNVLYSCTMTIKSYSILLEANSTAAYPSLAIQSLLVKQLEILTTPGCFFSRHAIKRPTKASSMHSF